MLDQTPTETTSNRQLMSPENRHQLEILHSMLSNIISPNKERDSYTQEDSGEKEKKSLTLPSNKIFWEILPAEVILYILSFLSIAELVTLRLVDKITKDLASDDLLWRPIARKFFGAEKLEENSEAECFSFWYQTYTDYLQSWSGKRLDIEDAPVLGYTEPDAITKNVKMLISAVLSGKINVVKDFLDEKNSHFYSYCQIKNGDTEQTIYDLLISLAHCNSQNEIIRLIFIFYINLILHVQQFHLNQYHLGDPDAIPFLVEIEKILNSTFNEITEEEISSFLDNVSKHSNYITNPEECEVSYSSDFIRVLKDMTLWLLQRTQLPLPENFPVTELFERAYQLDSFQWVKSLLEKVRSEETLLGMIFDPTLNKQGQIFSKILEYLVIERNMGEVILKKAHGKRDNFIEAAVQKILYNHMTEKHEQQPVRELEKLSVLASSETCPSLGNNGFTMYGNVDSKKSDDAPEEPQALSNNDVLEVSIEPNIVSSNIATYCILM